MYCNTPEIENSYTQKMIVLAIFLCCLVAVQTTDKEPGEIDVVLSEGTVLKLNCTGTRYLTPYVAINDVPISSNVATELLANLSVEESVLRDSTRRLVLHFKLNITNETFTFECNNSSNYCYTLKLNVQVHHPPPENVTIEYSPKSSAIQLQWNPPYSTVNYHIHKIYHIHPHIIQYTVYTVDAYTGKIVGQVNTTETRLTLSIAPDDSSCLKFEVSTWNDGGEGATSEAVLLFDCQQSTDTSTTGTSTPTTSATVTTSTPAGTNSTDGDTPSTSGDNEQGLGDHTTLIATVVGLVVMSTIAVPIIVILVWRKRNRKDSLLKKPNQSLSRKIFKNPRPPGVTVALCSDIHSAIQ